MQEKFNVDGYVKQHSPKQGDFALAGYVGCDYCRRAGAGGEIRHSQERAMVARKHSNSIRS